MELIDHFLSVLGENDQSKERVDREALTRIVDSVAFVKVEDGVKFVCLKAEGSAGSVMRADTGGHDHAECNGNIQEDDNNYVNGNPDNREQTGEGRNIITVIVWWLNCLKVYVNVYMFLIKHIAHLCNQWHFIPPPHTCFALHL